ncbi:ABC-type Na+ efflux pump, permease component [Clostridium collagenovorans DSM 3089]|uniref:ABC-type Na+ efflux pump, permease component n=1 Tax=Clostridium collagenovorans DSM 3089 TaxID=1121306 RepID=A0A1M5YG34_9CLOT|nr:ABC transporter permease subunit [Clostridium collagenovorans]SHI10818.1 ABC-type Na+ efflux pump, permease component [Clostridium collagenovorans DSM 3089]
MWVLIKHELKRFFKSKFPLIFTILIVLLNVFVGLNYKSLSESYTWEDEFKSFQNFDFTNHEIASSQFNSQLDSIDENTSDKAEIEEREHILLEMQKLEENLKYYENLKMYAENKDAGKISELILNDTKLRNQRVLKKIENNNYGNSEETNRYFVFELMHQYIYDNNLTPRADVWSDYSALGLLVILFQKYYIIILPILFLIVASTSISGEFSNNTYKLLFSQPIKKHKIIIPKIISSIIVSTFLILVAALSALIIGTILNGFGELNAPILIFENLTKNPMKKCGILEYTHIETTILVLGKLISYTIFISIFINSMAILISSLFKNKLTSIITSIIIFIGTYFTAPLITGIKAFNPMTYLNSYEIITGINSLTIPEIQLNLGVFILLTLSIIFIAFTLIKMKKSHI